MKNMLLTILSCFLLLACSGKNNFFNNLPPTYIGYANSAHVKWGNVRPNIGLTSGLGSKLVQIVKGLHPDHQRMVVTHELFHVFGYTGHIRNRPDCYFDAAPKVRAPMPFCDADIRIIKKAAKRLNKPIYITSIEDLKQDVLWAIKRHNNIAGKEIFRYVERKSKRRR